jgi:hypothetical protein
MEHTGPARKWNRLMKGKQYNYGTLITIWKSCYYFVCTVNLLLFVVDQCLWIVSSHEIKNSTSICYHIHVVHMCGL